MKDHHGFRAGKVSAIIAAMPVPLLEICVETPAGMAAAIAGGAQRIELCSALALGGLTPSAGLMAWAGRQGVAVRAMIRPRAGNFAFDANETATMRDDIARARDAGLEGVVIGASTASGDLDLVTLEMLVRAASGMGATLHRVVDLLPSPRAAVARAMTLGIDTILSSGGALKAADGAEELAAMVALAGDALTIMPGSGVRAENAAALVAATGARAIHASCARMEPSGDPRAVAMGFAPTQHAVTDGEAVARLRAALG
jgi:copper homeostasis protein